MRKIKELLLINPSSGLTKANNTVDYIVKRLQSHYPNLEVKHSKSKEDLINICKNAFLSYSIIIFAGGDGTFNMVLNAIAVNTIKPVLGYIPFGTVNDIAKSYHIPTKIKKAVDNIIYGKPVYFDAGKINNQYFAYVSALGMFTDVSYKTNPKLKKYIGKVGYFLYGARELLSMQCFHIKMLVNGKIVDANTPFFLVLNSRNAAGFLINKKADLHDGKADVFLVKEDSFKGFINFINFVVFKNNHNVIHYKTDKLEVVIDDKINWCIDGEQGCSGKASITICHDFYRLLMS